MMIPSRTASTAAMLRLCCGFMRSLPSSFTSISSIGLFNRNAIANPRINGVVREQTRLSERMMKSILSKAKYMLIPMAITITYSHIFFLMSSVNLNFI